MGKEGGRAFVSLEDFVIHAYLRFVRTDRITLAPQLLTELLAIGTDEQVYGLVDALPPLLRHGRLVLLPIFITSEQDEAPHWLLACIDPRARAVLYLDSFESECDERTAQLGMLCQALAMCDPAWEGTAAEPWGRWRDGVPQQSNKTDCGVFVMEYVRLLAAGTQPERTAARTQRAWKGGALRRRMTLELLQWWHLV